MIQILDCTLRDGGYYTQWDFSAALREKYLVAMSNLPVSIVELGYRSPAKTTYMGAHFYLPVQLLAQAKQVLRADQQLALMLNARDCATPAETQQLLENCKNKVDIVRFAVTPDEIESKIPVFTAVAEMGFQVGVNVMYLSNYIQNPSILAPFLRLGKSIQSIALVDSYGACYPEQVYDFVMKVKAMLPQKIGFHGHDNLSMAMANSLAAIKGGCDILDSTLNGMGRGAGNLKTELILLHQATCGHKTPVDLIILSDLLEDFHALQQQYQWGSQLPYMLSGYHNLPQAEVMNWLSKRRYKLPVIIQALQNKVGIEKDETHYANLVAKQNDATTPPVCLIIGGGASVPENAEALARWISTEQGVIIHSSLKHIKLFQHLNVPQYACLIGHDLKRFSVAEQGEINTFITNWVLSPPPRFQGTAPVATNNNVCQVKPFECYKEPTLLDSINDTSPLAQALGVSECFFSNPTYLAGFDGYENPSECEQVLAKEVQWVIDSYKKMFPEKQLITVTPSRYNIAQGSVYSFLQSGLLSCPIQTH